MRRSKRFHTPSKRFHTPVEDGCVTKFNKNCEMGNFLETGKSSPDTASEKSPVSSIKRVLLSG